MFKIRMIHKEIDLWFHNHILHFYFQEITNTIRDRYWEAIDSDWSEYHFVYRGYLYLPYSAGSSGFCLSIEQTRTCYGTISRTAGTPTEIDYKIASNYSLIST